MILEIGRTLGPADRIWFRLRCLYQISVHLLALQRLRCFRCEAAASRPHSREAGSVLPWPPPVNFPVKLLFLVPLAISARFYPGRIFESSAKPFASAFVRVNPV